ncbi:MAG TPA: MoaD/ThiS family protein [Gemmatimonadaceae bacterium]|nr:MoaD/ThiS family protein [Gemmatimonadaceae bacterium]
MSASALEIDVLLFASFAEAFGSDRVRLSLPADATVATVIAGVQAASRALSDAPPLPATVRVAVNQAIAAPEQRVRAGDEVAIIPPVAGG